MVLYDLHINNSEEARMQQDNFSLTFVDEPQDSCQQSELNDVKDPASFICFPKASTETHTVSYDLSSTWLIGRRLADMADDMNDEYTSEIAGILRRIGVVGGLTPSAIARRMSRTLSEGISSWSGLVVLVLFGCRMALHLSGLEEREFLRRVAHFLVQYTFKGKIAGCALDRNGGTISGSVMKT